MLEKETVVAIKTPKASAVIKATEATAIPAIKKPRSPNPRVPLNPGCKPRPLRPNVHRPSRCRVMRRDARSRKQNCKPQLPIQRVPQRGESRGVIGVVVRRRCHGDHPRVTQKPEPSSPWRSPLSSGPVGDHSSLPVWITCSSSVANLGFNAFSVARSFSASAFRPILRKRTPRYSYASARVGLS
jgi:hypothetical protein